MLSSDFDREIKRINSDFFLDFNPVRKKYQVCLKEPILRSFYTVIEDQKAKITYSDTTKRVIKTLSKDELDDRALLMLRRMEYNFNNKNLIEESKKADEHNKKLDELNAEKGRKEIQHAATSAFRDMNKTVFSVGG